MKLWA